jgi:hypothetical protein
MTNIEKSRAFFDGIVGCYSDQRDMRDRPRFLEHLTNQLHHLQEENKALWMQLTRVQEIFLPHSFNFNAIFLIAVITQF